MSELVIRMPNHSDYEHAMRAEAELAEEDFDFTLIDDDATWPEYLATVASKHKGENLPPNYVRATMYFAFVDDELAGRVHIRHELNEYLTRIGGHVGYGVRPQFRQRGYATQMLQFAVRELQSEGTTRILVTCDVENEASARTIEACGGRFENVIEGANRYWIEPAPPQ